jgi:SAM-dependent methyltransferase
LSADPWLPRLVCPECRTPLGPANIDSGGVHSARCTTCGTTFERQGSLWRLLSGARRRQSAGFVAQYRAVRERDGHRSPAPEYYRMLPSVPRDDPHADEWRIRRESYAHLLEHAIPDIWLGAAGVLELGAGCGWLSYRLATLGHRAVAVDRLDDDADGLGACRHYPLAFPAVQADFDALPFEPYQFDVVVFNASLHYSGNPAASLREAARMVSPGGAVAVMDSPTFYRDADGEAMVADQRRQMMTEHGLDDPLRAGAGFLTYAGMERAFQSLGLSCRFFRSRGPLPWRVRRQFGRWRLGRQPAAFGVWVAR